MTRGKAGTTTKKKCEVCGRMATFTLTAMRRHRSSYNCKTGFSKYIHVSLGRPVVNHRPPSAAELERRAALNRARVARCWAKKKARKLAAKQAALKLDESGPDSL